MFRLHQIEQFKSGRRTEKKIRCGRLSEIDLFHARPQNCDRAFLFVLKQITPGIRKQIQFLQKTRIAEKTAECIGNLLECKRRQHGVHFKCAVIAGVHELDTVLMLESDQPCTGAIGAADLLRITEIVSIGGKPVQMSGRNRIIGDERRSPAAKRKPMHSLR